MGILQNMYAIEYRGIREIFDEESKLWWNGPSYIADMYLKEKKLIDVI